MCRDNRFLALFTRLLAVLMLASAIVAAAPSAAPAAVIAAAPAEMAAAAAPAAPAGSGITCQVLQPGPTLAKDAYIKQEKVDERRGTDPELRIKTETGKLQRALLQFDLSSIPVNSVVTGATMSLWVKDATGGAVTINAHAVTNAWNEAQVSWKARDKAANLLWTSLGGDYNAAVVSSTVVNDTKNIWRSWDVTGLATGWVSSPATNLGVILESPVTNPKTEKKFKSSDDGTASQRPKLEVCYTAAITIEPDNLGDGVAGLTRTYAHVVRVGNLTTVVALSAGSNQGWPTRIYRDVDGDGLKDSEDTIIAATPAIGPNAEYPILVQVDVPISAPAGIIDVTTVTATAQATGASASATDRTRIGRMLNLQPDHAMKATAGTVLFYGHTLTNNGDSRDCATITATSSLGWTVFLWDDLNHNGVHETANPNEPALSNPVCLDPGETTYLVAEVRVSTGAAAGAVDQTVIRVVSGNTPGRFDTATDTTTVFVDSPPVIDGKYDGIYTDSPYSEEVCYSDANGVLFGKLATYYQPAANAVYVVLAIDKDFVDNTYGANAVGWPGGHTFGNLTGSDHAQFIGYDSNGLEVLNIKVDYLTSTTGTPSGYASLGVTGGEGDVLVGSAASIQDWGTSLEYSLNATGYCSGGNCNLFGTDLEVNSPATDAYYTPNATYPNFIYDVIYEVQIAKTAFAAGFGSLEVPYIHASPSKAGTNTIYAEPGVCPGEIGDRVWHDQDGDTVQDAGEPGIGGVQVKLYQDNGDGYFDSTADTLLGTRTTSAAGAYLFSDLAPNDYFVDVVDATVPAGYRITTYNDPTSVITLDEGESYLTADFGYGLGAPIGDFVWEDLNHDGIQDAGEPGVEGVTVNLLDGSGALLATTTTDAIGAYLFPNRAAGSYRVEFVLPAGYTFTAQGQGGNPVKDSDADPLTGRTAVFTTTATPDLNRDAGLVGMGALGDFVWYDADADGIQDVGEPGIANVTLDLYRGSVKLTSTATDADGGYLFLNLPAGSYTVDVTDENGVLVGMTHIVAYQSQPDPNGPISLSPGEVYKDADFGYVKLPDLGNALIGDTVWYDADADGFQQPGEPGIPGIQVCAAPSGGGSALCVTTDAAGHYLIEAPAGSYNVAPVNPPAGYTLTTPPAPLPVTVAAGEQYLDADFGYDSADLGAIGNLVFLDPNKNGIFDAGDSPLPGVSVDLIRDTNGNLAWNDGEPIIATVTTGSVLGANNSNYLFTGAPAGNYLVHVSDTNGVLRDLVKSPLGAAGIDNNNQADPYPVALAPAASVLTADFGYTPDGGGDTGWPVGVIGNQVWIETDGNGLFDPADGDFGQPGVTVELLKDGLPFAVTTTGASGDYAFLGLDAGSYSVHVVDDLGVLTGYRVTVLGANPGQDNNNQAQPYAVALPTGGRNLTADFGYIMPGAIGDYVWYDTDADGIQDVGEPGIGNVMLDLYRITYSDIGVTEELVASTLTDVDGGYIFTGLVSGFYSVDVDQTSAVPAGLTHTSGPQSQPDPFGPINLAPAQIYRDADFGYVKQPASGDAVIGDTVWYDGDGDGLRDPGEPGIPGIQVCANPAGGGSGFCDTTDENGMYLIDAPAGTYTVAPANPPAGYTATTPVPHGPVTVNAGDQYLDADFGYDSPNLARLGGTVWEDLGVDGLLDAGEPGIPSVSVDLIRDNGNGTWDAGEPVIATTTTDQAGNYDFEGLPAGAYLVIVSDTQNVLDDFVLTVLGPNQGQDSNNQRQPYAVALPVSGVNTTADFGYVRFGTVDLLGVIGNQVWYEPDGNGIYNPEDGDLGIAGVTVALYLNGVLFDTTTTGASGDYVFTSLPSGSYSVRVIDTFGVLADFTPTVLGPNPGQDNNNQAQPYAIVLAAAGINMSADFGYTRPGAIGDFVWYDIDADGIEDVDEHGIANVTLDLYRGGAKIASTVTDADGGYLFPKLPPGNYTVDVTDQNGALGGMIHIVAYQSQPDPTASISLGAGETYKDADFGYRKQPAAGSAIIGDTVWYDANADGFQQPDEPGIPGIQVCATPTGAGIVVCAVTDANGHYLLEVAAGSYTVRPNNPPSGYALTTPPVPLPVTVVAGQQYLDADFGYDSDSLLGAIGNLVFLDANKNGVFDAGESPLAGVSVDLIRNTTFNQTWDAGEPIIATVTTGSALDANSGNYRFTGVPAGNYLVHVSDTNGVLIDFTVSPLGAAGADNNNQIDPYPVSISAGGSNLTADFGYWRMSRPAVGVIGNQVWVETDGNGLFDPANGDFGQAGVTVDLFRDGQSYGKTTTGASGDYAFIGLPAGAYTVTVTDDFDVLSLYAVTLLGPNPGQDNNNQAQPYAVLLPVGGYNLTADFGYLVPQSSIGDTVFFDDNRNGTQDPGEDGIMVVLVQLFTNNGGDCNQLVATTTTDSNGKYIFANLPPGHYCVVVPESADDNGSLIGLQRTAGANPHALDLAANQHYLDADFGYAGLGIIRGVAYLDLNNDGVQQPNEPGLANVYICLYPDVNQDGTPDSTTPLACTTTDSSGAYVFHALLPGGYAMTETDPGGLASTTPNTISTVLVASQGVVNVSDGNDFGDGATATYTITKTLTSPNPTRPGQQVTFEITIVNTGSSWISFLPMQDTYNNTFLTYGYGGQFATPDTDDNDNDGVLNWSDLTAAPPYGFGADLAPNETRVITISFTARADTSALPNQQVVNYVTTTNALADPDGPTGPLGSLLEPPDAQSDAAVSIYMPTGVTIESFAAALAENGVAVSWRSASEAGIIGFNVLRATGEGEFETVNAEFIPAAFAGLEQGADYTFADLSAAPGVSYIYVLEVIKMDGSADRFGRAEVAAR